MSSRSDVEDLVEAGSVAAAEIRQAVQAACDEIDRGLATAADESHAGSRESITLIALGEHLAELLGSISDDCVRLDEACARTRNLAGLGSSATATKVKAPAPSGPTRPARSARNDRGPSEGVRLLVTQMAAAGSSIEEIERSLRDTYGVGGAAEAVAAIFGSETGR